MFVDRHGIIGDSRAGFFSAIFPQQLLDVMGDGRMLYPLLIGEHAENRKSITVCDVTPLPSLSIPMLMLLLRCGVGSYCWSYTSMLCVLPPVSWWSNRQPAATTADGRMEVNVKNNVFISSDEMNEIDVLIDFYAAADHHHNSPRDNSMLSSSICRRNIRSFLIDLLNASYFILFLIFCYFSH